MKNKIILKRISCAIMSATICTQILIPTISADSPDNDPNTQITQMYQQVKKDEIAKLERLCRIVFTNKNFEDIPEEHKLEVVKIINDFLRSCIGTSQNYNSHVPELKQVARQLGISAKNDYQMDMSPVELVLTAVTSEDTFNRIKNSSPPQKDKISYISPSDPLARQKEVLTSYFGDGALTDHKTFCNAFYKKYYAIIRTLLIEWFKAMADAESSSLNETLKNVNNGLKKAGAFFSSTKFKVGGGVLAGGLILLIVGKIFNSSRSMGQEISYAFKNLFDKVLSRGMQLKKYQQCLNKIEKRLRKELIGQDAAIDQVINIMGGYYQSMLEAKERGEKFEGGLMLYLTGSPATGKSTMMKIIQEELNLNNFSAKMSDVIEDKGNNANTVAARLTKPTEEKTRFKTIVIQTPLMKQLSYHNSTLYTFDEIDKMRKLDTQLQTQNIPSKGAAANTINSIDELLRNFVDTGHIAGVDASGSVVIATSNETDEDINNLDPSLANRYRPYRVAFKDFNEDDYKEIIKRASVKVQDYYKEKFNAEVKWDDSSLNAIAKKMVSEKAGGRCAEPLMMQVRRAITVLRNNNNDIKDKTLSIKVSEGENKKIFIKISK